MNKFYFLFLFVKTFKNQFFPKELQAGLHYGLTYLSDVCDVAKQIQLSSVRDFATKAQVESQVGQRRKRLQAQVSDFTNMAQVEML